MKGNQNGKVLIFVWLSFLFAFFFSGCGRATQIPQSTSDGPITLALIHGRLIDGTGAEPLEDTAILISGQEIAAVGETNQISIPDGVKIIDLQGATVLPGIINAHIHRGFNEQNLKNWAQAGVTTVRDESASPDSINEYSSWQKKNAQDASLARLVSAGSMIGVPGGTARVLSLLLKRESRSCSTN
jgi:hypothetical protein